MELGGPHLIILGLLAAFIVVIVLLNRKSSKSDKKPGVPDQPK